MINRLRTFIFFAVLAGCATTTPATTVKQQPAVTAAELRSVLEGVGEQLQLAGNRPDAAALAIQLEPYFHPGLVSQIKSGSITPRPCGMFDPISCGESEIKILKAGTIKLGQDDAAYTCLAVKQQKGLRTFRVLFLLTEGAWKVASTHLFLDRAFDESFDSLINSCPS